MIVATVTGAAEVERSLSVLAEDARVRVRETVQGLGLEVLRLVKEDFLTGRALHVRSGRLRRSVNERTTESAGEIASSVGTNVAYARVWELGFSGTESVRAHTRRIGKTGIVAQVRAFQREVNVAARPFLAPALEEMRPRVVAELRKAVGRGI